MISLTTARRLLNLDQVMHNPQRAADQLEGAVAIHNILHQHGIAYLADEVGMGKTYVALAVVALLRHYRPDLRVLIVAPRQNIQDKWHREHQAFTRNNIQVNDLRTRMPDGQPARPLVSCRDLLTLVRECAIDPDRDFLLRLTSFSLPVRNDPQHRRRFRDRLRAELPWLPEGMLDLRSNVDDLKLQVAQAINTVLPTFDLVIVDEAHNLKHGWGPSASSRNRVLATVLGRGGVEPPAPLRSTYGPRVGRVLLVSATPVDDGYRQLWNQLDVFARAATYDVLKDGDATEEDKRTAVAEVLVRRVTALQVNGQKLTKNLYRREWRQGGVHQHDQPIRIVDDRQRLTVALVQKKVSDLLGYEHFGRRFQIGMLASFESFLETARPHLEAQADDEADSNEATFDGAEQAEDMTERRGVDVGFLNKIARSHRRRFGTDLPHPKMDALVDALSPSWRHGDKALVFVRRVASVTELKHRLDRRYDQWLIDRLRRRLDERHQPALDAMVDRYRQRSLSRVPRPRRPDEVPDGLDDAGGDDTFFAWFFRGEGPTGAVSGATIKNRIRSRSGQLGVLFDDNHVMTLLDHQTGQVTTTLATALSLPVETLRERLADLSRHYLTMGRSPTTGAQFDAVQGAALELLAHSDSSFRTMADIIWRALYLPARLGTSAQGRARPELLETTTFFTQLRQRPRLRDRLLPKPVLENTDPHAAFRNQYLRAQLLSATARLGHAFIDLYTIITDHLSTLDAAAALDSHGGIAAAYLDELQRQMDSPRPGRDWSAFDELETVAQHHDLLLDTNLSKAHSTPLPEIPAMVGRLFGSQQPVAGMVNRVTPRLVAQFRLPGYPLVLICTDVLQEGEDLHTFCSQVHHYGLAWTPSATEQRVGRIDRVRSHTERRLTNADSTPAGDDLLQVYYPHLADTVERLQVRRVLRRLDDFTHLMHQTLKAPQTNDSHIDLAQEVLADDPIPAPPRQVLDTSFPVRPQHLAGEDRPLAVDPSRAQQITQRFHAYTAHPASDLKIEWEGTQPTNGQLAGTAEPNSGHPQRFTLQLEWYREHPVVRCTSPVALFDPTGGLPDLHDSTANTSVRVCIVPTRDHDTYEMTLEECVTLTDPGSDAARIYALIRRVTSQADALAQPAPERTELLKPFKIRVAGRVGDRQDWQQWCVADDIAVNGSRITVRFSGKRSHTVRVSAVGDGYLVTAGITRVDKAPHQLCKELWARNHRSKLVGLNLDQRGTIYVHSWTPGHGLSPSHFQQLVRHAAREADRHELRLTGRDLR